MSIDVAVPAEKLSLEAVAARVENVERLLVALHAKVDELMRQKTVFALSDSFASEEAMDQANNDPTFTPEQLGEIRSRLALTKVAAARKVGITPTAWGYLENGTNNISKPVAKLIQLLSEGKLV